MQELETVLDESKVEKDTISSQTVSTMTNDLDTSYWVVAIEASENFVVGEAFFLFRFRAIG